MRWLKDEWVERGLGLIPAPVEPSAAELVALEEAALLVPLTDSSLLTLGGNDRVDFLHGQVSNDVRGLRVGRANRSLLLNHKGHALAQLSVLKRDQELLVLVDGGAGEVVAESLRRHIIFDQVELGRPEDVAVLTLQGPESANVLRDALAIVPPEAGEFAVADLGGEPLTLLASARTASGGFDVLAGGAALGALVGSLLEAGAERGGRPALELARVRSGIPSASSEAGDGILPQEAGLEPLVSYRKGCYLGQEIMARIEARGNMRRALAGVRLDGVPEEGERDIVFEGKRVGRLGLTVMDPELGVLGLAVLRSDLPLEAELEVGGVRARQTPLPV